MIATLPAGLFATEMEWQRRLQGRGPQASSAAADRVWSEILRGKRE